MSAAAHNSVPSTGAKAAATGARRGEAIGRLCSPTAAFLDVDRGAKEEAEEGPVTINGAGTAAGNAGAHAAVAIEGAVDADGGVARVVVALEAAVAPREVAAVTASSKARLSAKPRCGGRDTSRRR